MSCTKTKKYLDAYVDGELEATTLIELENHIDKCEQCAAHLNLKRTLKKEISSLESKVKAPEHLKARVISASTRRQRRPFLIAGAAIPLAAAAAMLLIFVTGSNPEESKLIMTEVVHDVVQHHVQELPMDIKGPDQTQATSWLRNKVDFSVRTPRLALQEASFKGARVSNVQSNQAAQMVYNVDGHRVTLMIFPTRRLNIRNGNLIRVNGREILVSKRNGYNVAVMIDGDMAYALSSDLPSKRLVSLFKTDRSI